MLPVDVVVAVVFVAPGGSPVQGEGQRGISVHGPRQEVLVVDGGVLYGLVEQQLALAQGPVLDHVEVSDLEVLGDVPRYPDVVNPEEPDLGGGLRDGGRGARVGDVEPASAVGGVDLSLDCRVTGNVLVRGKPFAFRVSLREVTGSVRLETFTVLGKSI